MPGPRPLPLTLFVIAVRPGCCRVWWAAGPRIVAAKFWSSGPVKQGSKAVSINQQSCSETFWSATNMWGPMYILIVCCALRCRPMPPASH
ncbi:uncharacterized protein BCR38DRAFT_424429 [Pseudomassariella vexata]|uniref:Secreted protein n=1 Tax=Pseudomassariella vexata TaxID=1141098 RepID=A0A1Y2EB65_9PEZI|nr:uncharacterized protein BCR38DRAFT_424429 [Pseudomassariella vexata]ORY68819.1 hypothetical protein BCR38DRAFT_424429 [Pseudomassariella vexata]